MAVQIKRTPSGGGQSDISSVVEWASVSMMLVLTKEVSTLSFDVLSTPATAASVPAVGDTIDVYEDQASGNVHIFGGTVTERKLTVDGGKQARYSVNVTDWGYVFDGKNVAKTYTATDPGTIVKDIISTYCPGFTSTNVALAGYTMPSLKFNYQPPTKCIQKIATLIGWDWYIDAAKDVHFFQGDLAGGVGGKPAPFNLDDTTGNLEWPTIDYSLSTKNLKNSVFVIGATYKKAYDNTNAVDVYKSVAGTTTYPLVYTYDLSTLVLKLAGVTKTVGTYGKDASGSFDALYYGGGGTSGGGAFIVFSADPGAGNAIQVTGNANVPILGFASDDVSIATYGEFDDTIVDKQITTVAEAQQRAVAELLQYGAPLGDLKFKTLKTGLMVGQSITLASTILGITTTLTIRRVHGVGYSPTQLEYQVEAQGTSSGTGSRVSFTDIMAVLLEAELNQNSVDDSTVLQVLLRISESLAVADVIGVPSATTGPYLWGSFTWGFGSWGP